MDSFLEIVKLFKEGGGCILVKKNFLGNYIYKYILDLMYFFCILRVKLELI